MDQNIRDIRELVKAKDGPFMPEGVQVSNTASILKDRQTRKETQSGLVC